MRLYATMMDSPSGVVDKGDKPKYTGERDYAVRAPRKNDHVNKDNFDCCSGDVKTGLTFKEPL
jgi:hypothetical protein